jgi:hypothetical protein
MTVKKDGHSIDYLIGGAKSTDKQSGKNGDKQSDKNKDKDLIINIEDDISDNEQK